MRAETANAQLHGSLVNYGDQISLVTAIRSLSLRRPDLSRYGDQISLVTAIRSFSLRRQDLSSYRPSDLPLLRRSDLSHNGDCVLVKATRSLSLKRSDLSLRRSDLYLRRSDLSLRRSDLSLKAIRSLVKGAAVSRCLNNVVRLSSYLEHLITQLLHCIN